MPYEPAVGHSWPTAPGSASRRTGSASHTRPASFVGFHPPASTRSGDGGRATLVGARTRISWPTRGELRHIPVVDPTPACPHSLMWRAGDRDPGLTAFRTYLAELPDARHEQNWVPSWA